MIATKALSRGSQFSVLIAQNQGTVDAPGFRSKGNGQSLGLGFATDLDFARLDLAVTGGKMEADGSRNGQTFSDQGMKSGSALARLSFSKLGAFTPFVGLHYASAKMDAFVESGSGANLRVAESSQSNTFAEAGLGYALPLNEMLSLTVNVAYEHNLGSTGNQLNAAFADASAPTSFTVRTYGAGQDIFRGGIGLQANLGQGRSAGLSYDVHSGDELKSAHQIKANYTFRF
ncbi:MAG: autotransporter outer membrane beta-barrel domain-containing protein [Verrucomicrobia bacterium]|nr:autotransporter outer membrane beta-barrel domain-containing protein [Verrucomicrobiota bacterium]